jgi:hypothetical protein
MLRPVLNTDVFYDDIATQFIADSINAKIHTQVVAGAVAAGTVQLNNAAVTVVGVLAFVASSGAPAAKALLALTTDYTFVGSTLTCVTDQHLNNLVVFYTLSNLT